MACIYAALYMRSIYRVAKYGIIILLYKIYAYCMVYYSLLI